MKENLESEEEQKKILRDLANKASSMAYAPYSNFKVGCALLTTEGEIFTGSNVENASFGATICAERVAITQAIHQGKKKFKTFYITSKIGAAPCGMCLQVMVEFMSPDFPIILSDEQNQEKIYKLKELIPHCFGPQEFHQK